MTQLLGDAPQDFTMTQRPCVLSTPQEGAHLGSGAAAPPQREGPMTTDLEEADTV